MDGLSQCVAQGGREIFVEVADFFAYKARVEFEYLNLFEIVAINNRELLQNGESLRRYFDDCFGNKLPALFHLSDLRGDNAEHKHFLCERVGVDDDEVVRLR